MKLFTTLQTTLLLFLLASCSPKIVTNVPVPYPSFTNPASVVVYEEDDPVPANAETIGNVSILDKGLTIHCGYDRVLYLAKEATSKAGGNALYIVNHKKPSILGSSCHQISGLILYMNNTLHGDSLISDEFVALNQSIIRDVRRKRIPPRHIISANIGYGWIVNDNYRGLKGEKIRGHGGINWDASYEYVWRSGWSLGLMGNQFKSDEKDLNIKQTYLAAQIGYWERRNHWLMKAGIGGGYFLHDDYYLSRKGPGVNIQLGIEYMLTRFLGIAVSANTVTGFFKEKDDHNTKNYSLTRLNRIDVNGGLRFYF